MAKKSVKIENKYYVGANKALRSGWAKATEAEAIEHAREILARSDIEDEAIIVKVIKVVRRREPVIQLDLLDVK
jgi:uncharacterized protein with NRDE domain